MHKTIGFLPLRGGSKSIPLKNIKVINGKPLCYWVLEALETSKVDEIYVATDSKDITDTVNAMGFNKVKIFQRSSKNAQDSSSTESVILEFLEKNSYQDNDLFILVQATSPLLDSKHINEALQLLHDSKADSLLSAVVSKRFLWDKTGNPINYNYKKRPRRQDFSGYFMENGAFYINKIQNILKHKNRLSGKIAIYEMPEYTNLEIDEELDWLIVEILLKKYKN
ncbi:N-acylneuraminate cytidylyltransferase [Candidatus Hepatincola sp. Pdp]